MKASKYRVTREFRGCLDGQIYPIKLRPGDIIEGALGREAYFGGLAEEVKPPKPKTRKSSRDRKRKDTAAG